MWRPYPQALASYGLAIAEEWSRRGYTDTSWDYFAAYLADCPDWDDSMNPPWLGDPALHASHRSNLLRKNPTWYAQFDWREPPTLPYVWPKV